MRETHGWCPACKEESAIDAAGRCLWCDTQTEEHAGGETPAEKRRRYEQLGRKLCKVDPRVLELARALYQEQGMTMREVADRIFHLTPHEKVERLEEGLRRAFRRKGYKTRSTAESLKGKACRTEEHCKALNQRGRPCGGNVVADGYCWQHHPDYAENREALVHVERMRGRRRWMKELVPMEPFVAWLKRRRSELALPPAERRFSDRDEGLMRLSRATGVDQSTLYKWMQFQNSKQEEKRSITESKVREVLTADGTATFEDLYGDVELAEAA